jgi:hypothetical protein
MNIAASEVADAGVFANKPVRSFFVNKKPARKLLRASVRVAAVPVKIAVAPIKAVRAARISASEAPQKSAGCQCENCECVDCNCGE